MTTTQTTQFDRMVSEFRRARFIANNNRLGTANQVRADEKMEHLVYLAERLGFLGEFCRTVNAD